MKLFNERAETNDKVEKQNISKFNLKALDFYKKLLDTRVLDKPNLSKFKRHHSFNLLKLRSRETVYLISINPIKLLKSLANFKLAKKFISYIKFF